MELPKSAKGRPTPKRILHYNQSTTIQCHHNQEILFNCKWEIDKTFNDKSALFIQMPTHLLFRTQSQVLPNKSAVWLVPGRNVATSTQRWLMSTPGYDTNLPESWPLRFFQCLLFWQFLCAVFSALSGLSCVFPSTDFFSIYSPIRPDAHKSQANLV